MVFGWIGVILESQAGGRHMECACYFFAANFAAIRADGTWNVPATFGQYAMPFPIDTDGNHLF